ncbi:hypothetical protein [Algisphaera agarilytica]|uniref:Vacuolar-type H+-ATPase subunit H n=1 Tax=Algisphaera agarilytica TaxID=1385975 RepID=A0A7X0LJL5_9BACT|nr:hypothetical protein [Algisphaera agarilytica]MBB6428957.1 vacuolar-type H+-ATPase subunit H [Algisphaera agarilytica]
MSKRLILVCLTWALLCTATRAQETEGWEDLNVAELIQRSKLIATGSIAVGHSSEVGWDRGVLILDQTIYSGIGEAERLEVRIASKTVPGKTQSWLNKQRGLWFVLNEGDVYAPLNHPACRMDEDEAKDAANQVYAALNEAYEKAAEAVDEATGDGDEDTSDSDESIEAYAEATRAAAAASRVPFQDPGQQNQQLFERATKTIEQAGLKLPFDTDLSSNAGQQRFFDQVKQMLGPFGQSLGELPASGPGRDNLLNQAQGQIGQVLNNLTAQILGSKSPSQAPGLNGPGPLGNLDSGSRKDMLNQALGQMGQPSAGPGISPPSGGRPQPSGGGPKPGGTDGGPGPRGPGR